jgi:hypothetical protein
MGLQQLEKQLFSVEERFGYDSLLRLAAAISRSRAHLRPALQAQAQAPASAASRRPQSDLCK